MGRPSHCTPGAPLICSSVSREPSSPGRHGLSLSCGAGYVDLLPGLPDTLRVVVWRNGTVEVNRHLPYLISLKPFDSNLGDPAAGAAAGSSAERELEVYLHEG